MINDMSPLEERYRRLLRLLPADYRAAWEDEMVTTFLAGMATGEEDEDDYLADFGRPGWSEVASVVGLAVRLRLGGVSAAPRRRAWGDAVRLVGLVALLSHAVLAVTGLLNLLWLAGQIPGMPPPDDDWVYLATQQWPLARVLLSLAAVPAFLLLLAGRRGAARSFTAILVILVVVGAAVDVASGVRVTVAFLFTSLVDLLMLLAVGAFGADAPPLRSRPWLYGLPVGVALALSWATLSQHDLDSPWLMLDWPGQCAIVIAAAAVWHLTKPYVTKPYVTKPYVTKPFVTEPRPTELHPTEPHPTEPHPTKAGDPAWSLGMSLLVGLFLAQRALTLPEFVRSFPAERQSAVLVIGLVEVGALLAVAVPLFVRTAVALRRMSPAAPKALTVEG